MGSDFKNLFQSFQEKWFFSKKNCQVLKNAPKCRKIYLSVSFIQWLYGIDTDLTNESDMFLQMLYRKIKSGYIRYDNKQLI